LLKTLANNKHSSLLRVAQGKLQENIFGVDYTQHNNALDDDIQNNTKNTSLLVNDNQYNDTSHSNKNATLIANDIQYNDGHGL